MNRHIKDDSLSSDKKADGFIKQLLLSIGLGIALLVIALFASGIFFTGAVVQGMNETVKEYVRQ